MSGNNAEQKRVGKKKIRDDSQSNDDYDAESFNSTGENSDSSIEDNRKPVKRRQRASLKPTNKIAAKKKVTSKKRSNKKYGPPSERTCPFCKKVFSILSGLAYHVEHRVCQREVIDVDLDHENDKSAPKVHGKLMPGEKFVTSFGVVQVVADNRAPSSSDKFSSAQPQDLRKDSMMRRKNRIFIAAAKFQRKRRHQFMQLINQNVSGEKLQQEIWKEYCPSASPESILSGAWSWKTNKASTKVVISLDDDPVMGTVEKSDPLSEIYADRIVECVLIKDERRKITDIDEDLQDEGNQSKLDLAKAAVDKARKEALLANRGVNSALTASSCPSANHESGMKLYLQRRLLTERYNCAMPFYECFRCCRSFSSRLGLKGHLQESVCEKKSEQMMRERIDRLEIIETALEEGNVKDSLIEKKQPVATVVLTNSFGTRKIKASVFKKLPGWIVFHEDKSSMYPEVFEGLKFKRGSNNSKFMQKKFEALGPGRKRQRNRKRKFRELSTDVKPSPLISLRSRQCSSEVNRAKEYDSDDNSESSDHSNESSWDVELNDDEDAVNDYEEDHMPPLPASTFVIPEPYEILAPENEAQLTLNSSNLGSKASDKQNAPNATQSRSVAIKKKKNYKENVVQKNAVVESVTVNVDDETKVDPGKTSNPVIVDPSAFVEEILAGRYPSIKVFRGEHMAFCLICKEDGALLNCQFCSNAEHLGCLKMKVNIRNPEPDEEFMCHKCINTIMSRRARAQKRRLQKLDERLGSRKDDDAALFVDHMSGQTENETRGNGGHVNASVDADSIQTVDPNPDAKLNGGTDSDQRKKVPPSTISGETSQMPPLKCPHGGPGGLICCDFCCLNYSNKLSKTESELEAHMVSKIGTEVSELMELLTDAQIRLQQALDASKANDIRRKLLKTNKN